MTKTKFVDITEADCFVMPDISKDLVWVDDKPTLRAYIDVGAVETYYEIVFDGALQNCWDKWYYEGHLVLTQINPSAGIGKSGDGIVTLNTKLYKHKKDLMVNEQKIQDDMIEYLKERAEVRYKNLSDLRTFL